jgi:hypothetical protein
VPTAFAGRVLSGRPEQGELAVAGAEGVVPVLVSGDDVLEADPPELVGEWPDTWPLYASLGPRQGGELGPAAAGNFLFAHFFLPWYNKLTYLNSVLSFAG